MELTSSTETTTFVITDPSVRASSIPVTVTDCATFQLPGEKVRLVGVASTSPGSSLAIVSTTSERGSASRTTLKMSCVPVSDTVVEPPGSVIEKPATSSSVVVTVTVWFASASNASSEEPALTEMVMVDAWLPSSTRSSTPVTVTVCGVFQSPGVKMMLDTSTTTSPGSPEVMFSTTLETGCVSSWIVNPSVAPASETTVEPPLSVTWNRASSLSTVVTATV